MSRAHSRIIPSEQVGGAIDWQFNAVDQASLRFAAKLKAQAEAEDQSKSESDRKAGFGEGYNKGFSEGYAQAHAQATLEGDRKIADYIENQGEEAARAFGSLLAVSHQQIAESEQQMAQGLLELACSLAKRVLIHDLTVNPNAILPVIREALGILIADSRAALVRLNPADVEVVEPVLAQEFPGLAIKLLADTHIHRGGCQVESGGTVVDGTIEARWRRVVARLGLESAWEDSDATP
jgi:flagellar assembly protein FliH